MNPLHRQQRGARVARLRLLFFNSSDAVSFSETRISNGIPTVCGGGCYGQLTVWGQSDSSLCHAEACGQRLAAAFINSRSALVSGVIVVMYLCEFSCRDQVHGFALLFLHKVNSTPRVLLKPLLYHYWAAVVEDNKVYLPRYCFCGAFISLLSAAIALFEEQRLFLF